MNARKSTKTKHQTGHRKRTLKEPGEQHHSQVERRAFEIYMEHGSQPGHEVDDWLQAEKEVSEHEEAAKFG